MEFRGEFAAAKPGSTKGKSARGMGSSRLFLKEMVMRNFKSYVGNQLVLFTRECLTVKPSLPLPQMTPRLICYPSLDSDLEPVGTFKLQFFLIFFISQLFYLMKLLARRMYC